MFKLGSLPFINMLVVFVFSVTMMSCTKSEETCYLESQLLYEEFDSIRNKAGVSFFGKGSVDNSMVLSALFKTEESFQQNNGNTCVYYKEFSRQVEKFKIKYE